MKDYLTAPHTDTMMDVSRYARKRLGLSCPTPDGGRVPFDVYYPEEGEGPFPVVVNVSGGGWYYGAPSSVHLRDTPRHAIDRGYAFVSMACSSSRERKFPHQIREVRSLLRYLHRERAAFSLDTGFIALWSASSGGHLSLMAALTETGSEFDFPGEAQEPLPPVSAVAAIYSACRLGYPVEEFRALGLEPAFDRSGPNCADSVFLGCPVEDNPALCKKASPLTYLRPDAPPMLLLHGMADRTIPCTVSREFAGRYRELAGPEKLVACFPASLDHSDDRFKARPANELILDFLDMVRRGEELTRRAWEEEFLRALEG